MKYSELKAKVIEARELGFVRVPREGRWYKHFYLPFNYEARFYISSYDIMYGIFDLRTLTEEKYREYVQRAVEAIKNGKEVR